jgi:Tol biopolymer transport system component
MLSPTSGLPAALAGTKIVFNRNDGNWLPGAFMIDPDGSHETALPVGGLQPGVWSPDRHQLVVGVLVDAHSQPSNADTAWMRPALLNAKGSGFRVIDGVPGRKMNLVPLGWSPDGTRIYVFSGFDAALEDVGLFTVRVSDGGDLRSILPSDPDDVIYGRAGGSCARPDRVQLSPDGLHLLVSRQTPKDVCGTVLVFNSDGNGEVRLNPEGTVGVDLDIWDYLERGGISESWSHDGTRIAFGAAVLSADSTALFVARPDGSDVRQIVPPDVGGTTATWSSDDTWIAFTSRLRAPQVWRAHPDGSGLTPLTNGADGSWSAMPIWSPDGSKLLFERKRGGVVTLWTMNADGTDQVLLSPKPIGPEFFGPYAWWPAPTN